MVQDIGDRRADTVLLAGQAVDRATVQGLKTASAKSGVSFKYLLAKAAQESSLNPDAKADTSSATGLFQFTRGTWLDMVKRYGSQYGFSDLSRQILETPSGRLTVTDAAAEKRILALRNDPETSGLMAAEFARDNAGALQANLGREPDASDLYLAHFLGASGASTLLTARAGQDASELLPAAAKSNPAIFSGADGEPRSVAQVIKLIRDRFSGQMTRYASADTTATDAAPADPITRAAPAASGAVASAMPAGMLNRLQPRTDYGAGTPSNVNFMIMDQLLRMIAGGPAWPRHEDDGETDSDASRRTLTTSGLRGDDFANAIAKAHTQAQTPAAARAYSAEQPARTLDDVI